ncbi:MAG TPA: hypothetical protein EYO60_11470 [Candidatus Lambdaproteobacteria bacterium]|jgi:hypothetical protein|nr:hypothetical protein [Candidatus Lambdaproteobacteria bacterium]
MQVSLFSAPYNSIIRFFTIFLQDICKKIALNELKWEAEKSGKDFMLQDTGEMKWYNMASAKTYHTEDQPPWTSLL